MPHLIRLGHRGAVLPEGRPPFQNSRAAFQLALAHADGLETDACCSRDGEVFLIHDEGNGLAPYLTPESSTLAGSRRLDEMTSAEVRALRLRDGSPIPTLAETLALYQNAPGKLLNIELKGYQVLPAVLRTLAASPPLPPDQIILSSFDHATLQEARQLAPQFRIGALFDATSASPTPMYPWHPDSSGTYTPLTTAALSSPLLQSLDPAFVIIPESDLTTATLHLVKTHLPTARLMAWECGEHAAAPANPAPPLTDATVAGFIVNDPCRE